MVRVGRPPRDLAGEVDDRVLDAARQVFLERGLAGASIDEIARIARAGKPTIYSRFPTKEALFTAVGMRNAANARSRFENIAPAGKTVEERLVSVGTTLLRSLLSSDIIDFMRLAMTESRRFPELAIFGRGARERGVHAVNEVLSKVTQTEIGEYPAFAPKYLSTTTQLFVDLVVARLLQRALVGENLRQLRSEIDAHVERSVAFFLAACRHREAVDPSFR